MKTDYKVVKILPYLGVAGNTLEWLFIEYDYKEYSIVYEKAGNRVIVSDEAYWVPAPVGEELSTLVDLANYHGFQAGVVVTPIAWDYFGGQATAEQLIDLVVRSDFTAIDPYFGTGELSVEQLLWFSQVAIDTVHNLGKTITLAMQGFAVPGYEDTVVNYNKELSKLNFDEIIVFDAYDFGDIPDEWQLVELIACPTLADVVIAGV